jgi:hypothetical protein
LIGRSCLQLGEESHHESRVEEQELVEDQFGGQPEGDPRAPSPPSSPLQREREDLPVKGQAQEQVIFVIRHLSFVIGDSVCLPRGRAQAEVPGSLTNDQ